MAPPAPPVTSPSETLEAKLARVFPQLEDFLGEDGRFKTVESKVHALTKLFEGAEKIDIKAVVEQVEKNKAGLEALQKRIRTTKRGVDLQGAENEKFSLHNTLRAYGLCRSPEFRNASHKAIFESVGAGHEFEVLKMVDRARAEKKDLVYDDEAVMKLQSVGDDQLGGFFVADQLIPDIIGPIYTRSAFINATGEDGDRTRVSVLDGLLGGRAEIMKFDGGVVAFWLGEQDPVTESAAKTGSMFLSPKRLGCLVVMTEAMRKFGARGFDALLRRDMTRAMAKKIDLSIAYGIGGENQPLGIAKAAIAKGIKVFQAKQSGTDPKVDDSGVVDPATVTDWAGARLDFEALEKMKLALMEDNVDEDDTFAFISSPRYFTWLKTIRLPQFATGADETKSPFLLGMPMIPAARLREAIGDFAWTSQIPSNAKPGAGIDGPTTSSALKHTDVFAGNFGEVIFGRWAGIEITTDQGLGKYFDSGKEQIKLVTYVDVGIRQPRALIVCPNAQVRV